MDEVFLFVEKMPPHHKLMDCVAVEPHFVKGVITDDARSQHGDVHDMDERTNTKMAQILGRLEAASSVRI